MLKPFTYSPGGEEDNDDDCLPDCPPEGDYGLDGF